MFKIIHKDKKTHARTGILSTPHGKIKTPSYVIVATYGQIKLLRPPDIKRTKTQILICNTYHLWPGALRIKGGKSKIKNLKIKSFILKRLGLNIPTMTDSGGFQVFSLAFGKKNNIGKILAKDVLKEKPIRKTVKITDKGVYFLSEGKTKFLGPELSIKIQDRLDADIMFAFDECTSPLDNYGYNKKALTRTNKWAKICLKEHGRISRLRKRFGKSRQMLFGIVQGGLYKKLRIKSAKFTSSLPFDGFGIGGSFNKQQISEVLQWVIPHLPKEKPRHLLGIGKIEDVFEAVENGIDTMDCVIPTREARHGRLWTYNGKLDIRKGIYLKDKKLIEKGCKCPTCLKKISREQVRELFKSQDSVKKIVGKRYALMHNIWFFNNMLEEIRKSIKTGKFLEFKRKVLGKLK